LAVDGSKLFGTGFDRPQIGHTQVAFISLAGAGDGPVGLGMPGTLPMSASLGDAYLGIGLRIACEARLVDFGKRVILGEDLK